MAIKMITVVAVLFLSVYNCLGHHWRQQCSTGIQNPPYPPDHCLSGSVPEIPPDHIYHQLRSPRRPLVVGHRGNVQVAQENSFDSIKAVKRHGAKGFEVDVFLTADNQLVCFHDQNTYRLTGEEHNIETLTNATIQGLRYRRTIQYEIRRKTYDKRRKIAYLDEVLDWAMNENLLAYIEMKPEPVQDFVARQAQIQRSLLMGALVAQKVASRGMTKKVVVNSFDLVKTLAAKQAVNDLVIGTSWIQQYWSLPPSVITLQKLEFSVIFPTLASCLNPIPPENNTFIDFLFQSGTMEKQLLAAFTCVGLEMFNNSIFGATNNTMCMLEKNYGRKVVVGAYTMHELRKTEAQIKCEKKEYVKLLKDGVDVFYTDNICDMVQLVEETFHHSRIYSYSGGSGHRRCSNSRRRRSHISRRRRRRHGR